MIQQTPNKKWSLWLVLTAACGCALGLFVEADDFLGRNPAESRQWAVISFFLFLFGMVLFGLLERITLGLAGGLQKVGGKPGPQLGMQRGIFFRYAAWFFCGLALGLAISSLWRGADLLWNSLELAGAGGGILLGLRLREILFVKPHQTE
jgi:hypothetical protein